MQTENQNYGTFRNYKKTTENSGGTGDPFFWGREGKMFDRTTQTNFCMESSLLKAYQVLSGATEQVTSNNSGFYCSYVWGH